MEVSGKVKKIGLMVTAPSGTFSSRKLVVTTEEQYPQDIEIQFVQDKCDLLDLYKIGDGVKVGINLRGREWINPDTVKNPNGEAQYFNTIQGWRIEKTSTSQAPTSQVPAKKYVHTATDAPYKSYQDAGWTDEQLVANGKGNFVAVVPPMPVAASAPIPPAPVQTNDNDLPF